MTATTLRTIAGTAAAIAVGLTLASCSDDASAMTKPEYVEAANAICGEANAEVEPIWAAFWDSLDREPARAAGQDDLFERFVVVVDETADIWDGSLEEIRALGQPAGDEERLERLFDDFEAAIGELQQRARDAADGDDQAREALDGEEQDPFTEINMRAQVYGLTVCGTD